MSNGEGPRGPQSDSPGGRVVSIRRDTPATDVDDDEYPVLRYVLATYFPNVTERRSDRSVTFVDDYHRYGDTKAEWAGLGAELVDAVRHPDRSVVVVNDTLGTDLDPADARVLLADLADMLNRTGDYDETNAEKADDDAPVKATPQEMLDHWFYRRVTLRWPFGARPQREVPLWGCLAAGFVVSLVGYGMLSLNPPHWLAWGPLLVLVLGFLIVFASAGAMYALRDEIRSPEKEARRQAAREEAIAKAAARPPSRLRFLG